MTVKGGEETENIDVIIKTSIPVYTPTASGSETPTSTPVTETPKPDVIPPQVFPNTNVKPEFTIECSLSDSHESSLPVYKVIHKKIDKSWVRNFAAKHFNIFGEIKTLGSRNIYYKIKGEEYELELDANNGTIFLRSNDFYYSKNQKWRKNGELPDTVACIEIAKNYLDTINISIEEKYLKGITVYNGGRDHVSVYFKRKF